MSELWTAGEVRKRINEAAETALKLPNVKMPGWAEPSMWGEYQDGYAKPTRTRLSRQKPDGRVLDEMEETWSWINTWLTEDERHLVYQFSWTKARKGFKLWKLARRLNLSDSGLWRAMDDICAKIAENLNKSLIPHLTLNEKGQKSPPIQLHSKKCHQGRDPSSTSWMAEGAKPKVTQEVRAGRRDGVCNG